MYWANEYKVFIHDEAGRSQEELADAIARAVGTLGNSERGQRLFVGVQVTENGVDSFAPSEFDK